jgi:hypothetical protein
MDEAELRERRRKRWHERRAQKREWEEMHLVEEEETPNNSCRDLAVLLVAAIFFF